jgi:D-sedoheptulose 7-phosphate isomerase
MPNGNHVHSYFEQVGDIARRIDLARIEAIADALVDLRKRGGRLFVLGVGGSAANCAHAVNNFRKPCGIEAYAPTDNVSELTARTTTKAGRPCLQAGWKLAGFAAGTRSWSFRWAAAASSAT